MTAEEMRRHAEAHGWDDAGFAALCPAPAHEPDDDAEGEAQSDARFASYEEAQPTILALWKALMDEDVEHGSNIEGIFCAIFFAGWYAGRDYSTAKPS